MKVDFKLLTKLSLLCYIECSSSWKFGFASCKAGFLPSSLRFCFYVRWLYYILLYVVVKDFDSLMRLLLVTVAATVGLSYGAQKAKTGCLKKFLELDGSQVQAELIDMCVYPPNLTLGI